MSEIYQSEGQSVGQGDSLDPTDDLVPDEAAEDATSGEATQPGSSENLGAADSSVTDIPGGAGLP